MIDDYRHRTAQKAHRPTFEPPSEPQPEPVALANKQKRRLITLLGGLPTETREMLVLRYLLGWRVSEIAQQLDTSENSVSVTIHRALARPALGRRAVDALCCRSPPNRNDSDFCFGHTG